MRRIVTLALAVVLCLGLAVPVMAAYPATYDEAMEKMGMESTLSGYENYVEENYGLYTESYDWSTKELSVTQEEFDGTGYVIIPEDGTITIKSNDSVQDHYIRIVLRIYEKQKTGKYVERWAHNSGQGYDLRNGGFVERLIDGHKEYVEYDLQYKYVMPGESVVIDASELIALSQKKSITSAEFTPKSVENYLFRIELQQEYPDVGRYWYASWCYVIDDARAAKIKANGIVNPFDDVSKNDYFYDAVVWALKEEITTGMTEDLFGPKETCTRGQVATFLWRAKGCPEPETTENPFTDVSESDYYYKPILWAYENGITTGTTETTFSPNGTCTSAHVITFLWRANGEPEAKTEGTEYYAEAVAWATKNKLLDGTDMAFAPENLSPRGDIVTYLYRDAK